MELDASVVIDASQMVFSLFWADASEVRGKSLGGCAVNDVAPRADENELRAIMQRYIGRVENAWGVDVALMFHHMGLEGEDQVNALCDLMLGCLGHGVSIESHYDDAFARAKKILRGEHLRAAPTCFEGCEWRELAEEAVERDEQE